MVLLFVKSNLNKFKYVNYNLGTYLVLSLLLLPLVLGQELILHERLLFEKLNRLSHLNGGLKMFLLLSALELLFLELKIVILLSALLKLVQKLSLW